MRKLMSIAIYAFVMIVMWFLLQPLFWALGLLLGWLLPAPLAIFSKLIAVILVTLGIVGSMDNRKVGKA